MFNLSSEIINDNNNIFETCKKSLTEQFVLTELKSNTSSLPIYYWASDKGIANIAYVVQSKGKSIPIEVNYSANLQLKSLKAFIAKYHTKINVRTSLEKYTKDKIINIPLYLIGSMEEIIG